MKASDFELKPTRGPGRYLVGNGAGTVCTDGMLYGKGPTSTTAAGFMVNKDVINNN